VKRAVRSFEPAENVKEVLVDPNNSTDKMVRIGTALSPKKEGVIVDFLHVNRDIFAWKPSAKKSLSSWRPVLSRKYTTRSGYPIPFL